MAFNLTNFLKTSPPWFRRAGSDDDVILGVMGRLVRNLRGHAFPGWSKADDRRKVAEILLPAIRNCPGFKTAYRAEMSELDYGTRRALLERRQLSPCMAARHDGCHLIINKKQDTVVMINEEEHLAIHGFSPEPDFLSLISQLSVLPQELSKQVDFARDSKLGYLTSLPGEAGEGLQLYSILHLPALTLSNMLPQINRSIDKLQLNIAPFFPNLGEECGNIYVVYTAPIIHGALGEMLTHLTDITFAITHRELQVRERLHELHQRGDLFPMDKINRSYGLLSVARALTLTEWVESISMLRLGIGYGFIGSPDQSPSELRDQLATLLLRGGDFQTGTECPTREHPRAATLCDINRSRLIRPFINATTLLTAPDPL